MDVVLVAGVVALVLVALVAASVARSAWRMLRHNEEPEPGGSLGRQTFDRRR